MNPSQQNNLKPTMQNNNQHNNFSNTYNYGQFNLAQQKSQEQDEFLLDGVSDITPFPLANEGVRKQPFFNNFFNETKYERPLQQPYSTFGSHSQQPRATDSQDLSKKMLQYERELEELIRDSEKPQEKVVKPKVLTQKEKQNRQTMSRLSQQFGPKSGANIESAMQSRMKSRRTVGAFGAELGNKNQDQQKKIEQHQKDKKDLLDAYKPQKMELQKPYEQKKETPYKQDHRDQGQSNEVKTRLSEVVKQRERLSMGRENVKNMMKNIDQEEKKKQAKVEDQRRRVSMDLVTMINLISGVNMQELQVKKQEKKQELKKNDKQALINEKQPMSQVKEPARTKKPTEFSIPIELAKVIFQDDGQDDFTPMKSYFQSASKLQPHTNFITQQQQPRQQQQAPEPPTTAIDLQKKVYEMYFANIKQKVQQQKKVNQNLRKQKQQILIEHKKSLKQFTIDAKMRKAIEQQTQQVKGKIAQLQKKINKEDYMEYQRIINAFELKFGILLHNYQQLNRGAGKIDGSGYFVEFTYNDILFRVKRNDKDDPYVIKMQPVTTSRNQHIFNFKLDYQTRTTLYQQFISRKLKKAANFLQFITNLQAYWKAITQLEITMEYNIHLQALEEVQLVNGDTELEFRMGTCGTYNFFVRIDLVMLREDGGITIVQDGKGVVDIPENMVKWTLDGNKVQNIFTFLDNYSVELLCKFIDEGVERECKALEETK